MRASRAARPKPKTPAVFLDRDGVLNEVIFHKEMGIIETPFTAGQLRLLPRVGPAVRRLNRMGFRVIVASNQPGVAMRRFSRATLRKITQRLLRQLRRSGAHIDGVYYCVCHPTKGKGKLRRRCPCRKPNPGLLKMAARDFAVDLKRSYMIGDGVQDIQAGRRAGCKTILVGPMKLDWLRLLRREGVRPDAMVPDLASAARLIQKRGRRRG